MAAANLQDLNGTASDKNRNWYAASLVGMGILLLLILVIGVWKNWLIQDTRYLFGGAIAAILIFLAGLGWGINGRWDGALIDGRYKVSLSRLQLILWISLVLSALFTMALPRAVKTDGMDDQVEWRFYEQMQKEDVEQDTNRAAMCFPNANEERDEQLRQRAVQSDEEPPAVVDQPPIMVTIAPECKDPLGINLPGEILVLLGIGTASLTGSAIIKENKKRKTPDLTALRNVERQTKANYDRLSAEQANKTNALRDEEKGKTDFQNKVKAAKDKQTRNESLTEEEKKALAEEEEALKAFDTLIARYTSQSVDITKQAEDAKNEWETATKKVEGARKDAQEGQGMLHMRTKASQAEWADIFRGDDTTNYWIVDMSKVQMFLVTFVVLAVYVAALYNRLIVETAMLRHPLGVDLPAVTAGMDTLLGLSHAGYLTSKNTGDTPTKVTK